MMKKAFVSTVRGIIFFALILCLAGCGKCWPLLGSGGDGSGIAALGETEAEGHRRHLRNARINRQEMMADIDRFWLFDGPSRATPLRIP